MRANGFHYDAVKIFCDKNGRVTKVPYREYVIPDVTAGIFWLKNRDPQHWRDSQQLEHVLGKYVISDQPMTEGEWAKERANALPAGIFVSPFGCSVATGRHRSLSLPVLA